MRQKHLALLLLWTVLECIALGIGVGAALGTLYLITGENIIIQILERLT